MKYQQSEAKYEITVNELGYVESISEILDVSGMESNEEDGGKKAQYQPHEAVLTNLVCNN